MTQPSLLTAYRSSMVEQLRDGVVKIEHCLQQLSPEDIWTRPNDHMNSIANLLLHLAGNVRQWLICGLSDQPDLRKRQQEFDDRSEREPHELLEVLRRTIEEACSEINRQSEESLLAVRRVQQFDCDGLQTIADSVCHFRGHVQEIIHMTRVLKEDAYQFHFVPENPE
ncbi:MAG: DinB family protein [Planctomycetota bacterium]